MTPAPVLLAAFDYEALDTEVAALARRVVAGLRNRMGAYQAEIGRDLLSVKAAMPHGAFGKWLKAEFGMSPRTAENYMNASTFLEGKCETIAYLPPAALYALAAPSADTAVVAQVIADADAGKPMHGVEIVGSLKVAAKAKKDAEIEAAKSPERAKMDKENKRRRDVKEAAWKQKNHDEWAALKAASDARAISASRFIVKELGAEKATELLKLHGDDLHGVSRILAPDGILKISANTIGQWLEADTQRQEGEA